MNRIRPARLIIAGLATLVAFLLIELVRESLIGTAVFGDRLRLLRPSGSFLTWSLGEHALNLTIGLFTCFMMIWLYASLRPMFGVGARTALIAAGFVFAFVFAFHLNFANLGFIPHWQALLYCLDLIVELPLALLVGAEVYERGRWTVSEA
jgi:hypothetical protein